MAREHKPETVVCRDALEYFTHVYELGRRGWIYRGHAGSTIPDRDRGVDWRLESSLHRFLRQHSQRRIKPKGWYTREKESINRFQQLAHNFLRHVPNINDELAWLALIQHYGGPTRLIDFTFNAAAGLYFAIREVGPDSGPFCVHAIRLDSIRDHSRRLRASSRQQQVKECSRNPAKSEYGIGTGFKGVEFVGVYNGRLPSERQGAQEGLFLVPSKIDLDIEQWLQAISPPPGRGSPPGNSPWMRFVFENQKDQYYTIVKQLMNVGMSPARLFPGLEGLCESLKYSWLDVVKGLDPAED